MTFKINIIILLLIISINSIANGNDSILSINDNTNYILENNSNSEAENKQNKISIKYNFDLGSTLNNAFLQKFMFGGTIDNSLITNNFDRLSEHKNHFGSNSDFAIEYRRLMNDFIGFKNIGYTTSIEWHQTDEFDFTKDAFSMLMYGNKRFAGKNADLNKSNYNNLQYYQLKLGLFKKNPSRHSEFGFRIALNIGNKFTHLETHNASIYTDTLGREIMFDGEIYYSHTDYLGNDIGKIQGYGAGLDLFYKIAKDHKYKFKIDISNMGFINWNKNTISYINNEHIVFKGLEIDNIFAMPDPLISTTLSDTLSQHLELHNTTHSYTSLTPIKITLYYKRYINHNFSVSAKFCYKFFKLFQPYYQIGGEYHIHNKYHIGLNANYGGYTKFNIGASFRMRINTSFALEIQSRYLSGFLGNNFSGIGGFAQINYKF